MIERLKRFWHKIIIQLKRWTGRCEGCGTIKGLVRCSIYDYERDKEIYFNLCVECAPKHGFCWMCGQFWGGVESFDFGPGYCENCRDEIDYDEQFEEDEDFIILKQEEL